MQTFHSKHKWKILMPIEISQRELLYKTYLACHLVDRGYECYIGSKKEIYNLFDKVSPFIYLDKGYHKGVSEGIYNKVKSYAGLIISLDEEGAIDYKDSRTLLSRYTEKLFINSDLVFLWGNKQRDLLERMNVATHKCDISVSGHPRFDLLKESSKYLYSNEVSNIKAEHDKFILINTNMSLGNNIKGRKFVITNYGERKKGYLEDLMKYDEEKIQSILSFVKKIRLKTDQKIIIRPHPEENTEYYKRNLKYIKNLEITNKGSSIAWIIASELLVHTDCTTGIEAVYLNKKVISLLPYFNQDLTSFLPVELSISFNNVDHAINETLNKENSTINEDKKKLSLLNQYFNTSSSPINIISSKIDELKKNYNGIKLTELSSFQIFKIKLSYLISKFKIFFQSKALKSFRKQKLGEFNNNELRNIISILKENKISKDVNLSKITNNLSKIF